MDEDETLINELFDTMKNSGADYTNCMRALNRVPIPSSENEECEDSLTPLVEYFVSQCCSFKSFLRMNSPSLSPQQLQMMASLASQQPEMLMMLGKSAEFVVTQLKLHEKHQQLQKESSPEKKQLQDENLWRAWLKLYRSRLWKEVKEMKDPEQRKTFEENHFKLMNQNNPKFVLRNYLAQNAIAKAEKGDYSEVQNLLNALRRPFDEKTPYDGIYDKVRSPFIFFKTNFQKKSCLLIGVVQFV